MPSVRKRTRHAAKDDGPNRSQTQKLEKTQNIRAKDAGGRQLAVAQSAVRADTQLEKKRLAPPYLVA
jgi:hypothetical protein